MKHTLEEYELALKTIGKIYIDEGDEFFGDYHRVSSFEQFSILEDMFEDLKNAPRTVNIKRVTVFDNRK